MEGTTISSTAIIGAEYPSVDEACCAYFRVEAPDAQSVKLKLAGLDNLIDMVKGEDGAWTVKTEPLVKGFHYYTYLIDGADVKDSHTEGYYAGFWQSGIEVPEGPEGDYYRFNKDIPHGQSYVYPGIGKHPGSGSLALEREIEDEFQCIGGEGPYVMRSDTPETPVRGGETLIAIFIGWVKVLQKNLHFT